MQTRKGATSPLRAPHVTWLSPLQAAREEVRSGTKGRPLGATLVSRDYPYPLPSYLAVSGNIFKDCVVHDLDYLT
jgi:predicted dehydrogenase